MVDVSIRKHLMGVISRTRYVRENNSDADIERICEELGIRPELFWEATEEYVRLRGKEPKIRGRQEQETQSYSYVTVQVHAPEVVLTAWDELAKRWGFSRTSLLRSVIHEYLTGDREPSAKSFQREWLHSGFSNPGVNNRTVKCNVTYGALQALNLRAAKYHKTTHSALTKALFQDVLAGCFAGPSIKMVTRQQMFETAEDYRI